MKFLSRSFIKFSMSFLLVLTSMSNTLIYAQEETEYTPETQESVSESNDSKQENDETTSTIETDKKEETTDSPSTSSEGEQTPDNSSGTTKEDAANDYDISLVELDAPEQDDEYTISTVNATATIVSSSYYLYDTVSVDNTNVYVSSKWAKFTRKSDGQSVSGKAEPGTEYVMTFKLGANKDFVFSDDLKVKLNGNDTEVVIDDKGYATVTYTFEPNAELMQDITTASITLTAPVLNKEFTKKGSVALRTKDYYQRGFSINESDITYYTEDSVAKPATSYTVTIKLQNQSMFRYTENSVIKVNGDEAEFKLTDTGAEVTYTFPKTDSLEIANASVTIDSPKPGFELTKVAMFTVEGSDTEYTIDESNVSYTVSGKDIESNIAQYDTLYRVNFVLEAPEGYKFTRRTKITINGKNQTVSLNNDGTAKVGYTFAKVSCAELKNANIIIDSPVANTQLAKTALYTIAGSENEYVINEANISYTVDGVVVEDNVAQYETIYTVNFTLEAPVGYKFTKNSKISVNGKKQKVTLDGAFAKVSYIFDETKENVTEDNGVAKNTTTGEVYLSLAKATKNAKDGETIVLLKDVTDSVSISTGITLDLDGHTITAPEKSKIVSIDANGKLVTIKNGTLTGADSQVLYGGAIDIKSASEVDIDDVKFVNNKTAWQGGAIFASAQSGKLVVTNSTFENNSAVREGGAIYTSVETEITNCTFTGNSTSLDNPGSTGGAIYYASNNSPGSSTTLTLTNVKMENNTACAGGAIASGSSSYLYEGNVTGFTSTIVINGGTISNNTGKTNGGAVCLAGNGTRFIMNDGTISNNTTNGNGGAIYSSNWGGITINGGTINDNTAIDKGGAIYVEETEYSKTFGINTNLALGATVTGNNAYQGGGVYIKDAVQGNITGNVYNNTASVAGADIYANNAYNISLSGVNKDSELSIGCANGVSHPVDSWYNDTASSRWNAHGEETNWKLEPYTETILNGEVAIKAGHGVVTLKVDYIYEDGTTAKESYTAKYEMGGEYSVESPTISGYEADTGTVKGTVGTEDVNATVTYKRVVEPVVPTPTSTPEPTVNPGCPAGTVWNEERQVCETEVTPVVVPVVPNNGGGGDNTPTNTPVTTPEAAVEATPTPSTTTVIEDEVTPLVNGNKAWALINLIASIITAILAIVLLLSKHKKDNDDEEEDEEYAYQYQTSDEEEEPEQLTRKRRWKVAGTLVAIVSIILFILTEDIRQPMRLVDKWTIIMVILMLLNIVTLYFGRKWHEPDEEDEEEEKKAYHHTSAVSDD